MDSLEKTAYALLGFVCLLYVAVMIAGLIAAYPVGIFGLIAIVGIRLLLIKVIRERVRNREDDYYSKNIAIVAVRFVTAPAMRDGAEMLAYGTAVKLDKSLS